MAYIILRTSVLTSDLSLGKNLNHFIDRLNNLLENVSSFKVNIILSSGFVLITLRYLLEPLATVAKKNFLSRNSENKIYITKSTKNRSRETIRKMFVNDRFVLYDRLRWIERHAISSRKNLSCNLKRLELNLMIII